MLILMEGWWSRIGAINFSGTAQEVEPLLRREAMTLTEEACGISVSI
jgi:hypothetical protein